MSTYLGVDIGGTNVCYGISNADGEILYENSFKTDSFKTADELVSKIHSDLKRKQPLAGIGIGAPSVNERTQCIEFAPNLNWGDIVPIQKIFQEKFDIETVAVNDANAAAIGEKTYGDAPEMKNFGVITLGTGIGLGLYINNEVVIGANGLAGELGHSIIRPDGRECKCGNLGCLETYIAKEGIVRTAKEKLEFSSGGSLLNNISPSELSPTEIFKAARKEDPVALEVVDLVTKDLAFAISNLVNILDLECVFLTGGIAKNGNLLKRKTEKHLKTLILPNLRDKSFIKISSINDKNSGVLGAIASIHSKVGILLS
ncbi:ROK family protein [Crocinitomix algicola]|uniref:ROK family protein n=1 Tax=Crocinitomix algicola TaxID=1740263 RepID=UPI0008321240|nr:ROK family protein [Crocinitomix algicola]